MPSLRTLLSSLAPPRIGNAEQRFYVQNISNAAQNGGCCLLWTVPSNTSVATFELWGAGGDGPGARCCEWGGISPNSGSYAIRQIDVVPGRQYRLCAGGSGCEGCCCGISTRGFPSFVFDVTAAANIACACGGEGGNNDITRGNVDASTCCWARIGECGFGDFGMAGVGGVYFRNQFCHQAQYDIIPGGPSSGRVTTDKCAMGTGMAHSGTCAASTCPSFPAGAGGTGKACGGSFCFGQHGAGGLIKVSFS